MRQAYAPTLGPWMPQRRSRRLPSSASSVAASSGGCWRWRPGRWGIGSRSWTRTRRARPRRWRTRSSSVPTTTSMPRGGWRRMSAVVTYELEHVAAEVVEACAAAVPVRPGLRPLLVTQDRLAERRFVEGAGIAVAPWREVRSAADGRAAAAELGLPLRLKVPIGGYDGRGQMRIVTPPTSTAPGRRSVARPARRSSRSASSISRRRSRSSSRAALDGSCAAFPIARNRHDEGILAESVAPAPVVADVAERATAIGDDPRRRDGPGRDAHGGAVPAARWLAGRQRARAARPQLGPLDDRGRGDVANSSSTSGRSPGWGSARPRRSARRRWSTCRVRVRDARRDWLGAEVALADPAVHLHLYDKRDVFERRKMGHLTALGTDTNAALDRAQRALAALDWADDATEDDR